MPSPTPQENMSKTPDNPGVDHPGFDTATDLGGQVRMPTSLLIDQNNASQLIPGGLYQQALDEQMDEEALREQATATRQGSGTAPKPSPHHGG